MYGNLIMDNAKYMYIYMKNESPTKMALISCERTVRGAIKFNFKKKALVFLIKLKH